MRFPPTNSPYLTGKTSSFHGNRMEGENRRETETEGRMDVRVWRVESLQKQENEKHVYCFCLLSTARGGSVTSAAGEAAQYQQGL